MSKYLSGTRIFNSSGAVSTALTDTVFSTSTSIVTTNATLSTSSTTGSFTASGGLGIAKNIWIGTSYSGGTLSTNDIKGIVFNLPAATLTDNVMGAGTITNANSVTFGQITLASTNAITATNVATLYIAGAPLTSANITATNSYALRIASGRSIFSDSTASSSTTTGAVIVAGGVGISGALNVGGTISGTSANLSATANQLTLGTTNTITISAAAPAASRTYTIPNVGGNANFLTTAATYTGQNSAGITLNNNQTINTSSYLSGCSAYFGGNTITDNVTAANSTVALFADVYIGQKLISPANANVTYTEAASLYIAGPVGLGGNVATARQSSILINSGAIRSLNGSFISYALGTLSLPAFFIIAVGGLYGVAGNQMGMSVGNTLTQSWTTTQSQFPIVGSAAIPSIYFGTSTSTGLYAPVAGSIAMSSGGTNIWTTSAEGTTITATTAATSTTTGALVVSGGAGIGGNLYVGGTIFGTVNGTINTASISLTATSDQITLNSATGNTVKITAPTFAAPRTYTIRDAGGSADFIMSTFGAAQTVAGGLISSGLLTASNGFTLTTGALNLTSTSGAISLSGTSFTTNTAATITAATAATSTTTGALVVSGGAGIGGNLYVGGSVNGSSGLVVTSGNINFSASSGTFLTSTGAVTLGPGAVTTTGTLNIGKNTVLTPFSITGTSSPQTLAASATGTLIILNTSGNITLNLPSSPANGTVFMIINTANFTVILSTNSGSVYFDGDPAITSITMLQYDRIHVVYQDTNWFTF
jgi:hypothetical protein